MRYVWAMKPIDTFSRNEARLYCTNSKKLKFGEELYTNENGFVQRRKTENNIGCVIKTGKNLSMMEHFKLVFDLRQKFIRDFKQIKQNG